jgi:hypothetical protein
MTRFADGPNISLTDIARATARFRAASSPAAVFPIVPKENRYDFLFEDLQNDPGNLLEPNSTTAANLIRLGESMLDPNPIDPGDSRIPSAYTYLGQFIDHDITRQSLQPPQVLSATTLPLTLDEIRQATNSRSVGLDLDCLYGPAVEPGTAYDIPKDPNNGQKLKIERTASIPSTSELPREQKSPHAALIGDRRNDENLVISQLHLAFMLAHNRLVTEGESFESARQLLRRHYQWIVVNDYLLKIADPEIVSSILEGQLNLFDPPDDATFMPLEFAVAAFRFGHSMIRDVYNYNQFFERAQLFQLLLPGFLKLYHHILTEWTIDWRRFIDGRNMARSIDTRLAQGLKRIDDGRGNTLPFGMGTIDLLKGFLLRVPTGEAVARRLGETELSTTDMLKVVTTEQAEILVSGFEKRTPLWFYILAEAQASGTGRLGRVGSKVVASVLIGLARKSRDSYFRIKDWTPTLGTRPRFELPDLFQFAGVLPNNE